MCAVWYIPTVQHAELTRAGVNVAVGTANLFRLGAVTFGGAVGDGALLRDAVADWDFKNVTSTKWKIIQNELKADSIQRASFGSVRGMMTDHHLPAVSDFHLTAAGINVAV